MAKDIKTGGRQKGTPNKRTKDLYEVMGNYNPVTALLDILNNGQPDIDTQIKINAHLLPYVYPKRKAIEIDNAGEPININIVADYQ